MVLDPTLLSSHHVGGPGGTGAFGLPAAFSSDIHYVYYEADTDCTEQIEATHPGSLTTVLPLCLGKASGAERFHITFDPFMSSLRELNPHFADYIEYLVDPLKGGLDYTFGDTGRIMETRRIPTTSLDDLFTNDDPVAPPEANLLNAR